MTVGKRLRRFSPIGVIGWPARKCVFKTILSLQLTMFCSFGLLTPLSARPLIAQMVHTAWQAREGAPAGIEVLAQAKDGVLWIGATSGLFLFDGLKFSEFQSPAGEVEMPVGFVVSLFMAKDQSVWIGFAGGQLVHVEHGHVRIYKTADAIDIGRVVAIQQAPDGRLWAATQHRVLSLGPDDAWHGQQTPKDPFNRVFLIDSAGTSWVATDKALYRKARAQPEYTQVLDDTSIILALAEAQDGSLLVSDFVKATSTGRTRRLARDGKIIGQLPGHDVLFSSLSEPDGTVWLASENKGLTTIVTSSESGAADERYDRSNGLTSNIVHALLRDRDGNIWAGTDNGLDRFRLPRLFTADLDPLEQVWSICAGGKNEIWLANQMGNIYSVSGTSPHKFFTNVEDIFSITCAKDGTIWFISRAGIWHFQNGLIQQLPLQPRTDAYRTGQVLDFADNSLLVRDDISGLWTFSNGHFSVFATDKPLILKSRVAFIDSHDRVWTNDPDHENVIAVSETGRTRILDVGPSPLGRVGVFYETRYGIMAGGRSGIAVSRDGRFQTLNFLQANLALEITGLVESYNGDLWLLSSRGILHVGSDQIALAIHDKNYKMRADQFLEDGVVGAPISARGNKAAVDAQGRIWFAALNHVVWLDPANQPPKANLPLISIKSVRADGERPNVRNQINPDPAVTEIEFSGVNLSNPESVVYQYRLEGLDSSWQDVGHRTVAIYTHLHPGTYVFQVIASNGDNNWTKPVDSVPFTILPSFYQTWWFVSLCFLIVLVSAAFVLRLYIVAVAVTIKARAEARADERIRIAQDLHDTLLQGVQGLILTFHVAAQTATPNEESRTKWDNALSAANEIIIEGRSRVSHLRSERITAVELLNALSKLGNDLNLSGAITYLVTRTGMFADTAHRDLLEPYVVDEVFNIAREAVTNAFRHPSATNIILSLHYGLSAFTLICHDNGIGLKCGDGKSPTDHEHWGVRGMNERAGRLGGLFQIRSLSERGTEVRASIPALRAYKKTVWLRLAFSHAFGRCRR